MTKEVLIITNYFPPEIGAAPNRIFTLGEELLKKKVAVSVVCPLPNYPYGFVFKGYRGRLLSKKIESRISVYRLWHIASNSTNKFLRLFSMLTFCFSLSLFLLLKKTPEKIIIQCSPLLIGYTAVFIGKLKGKKIILNVSDLWPLAGLKMGILKKGWYYNYLEKLELYCYKNVHLILAQSKEIIIHIQKIHPDAKVVLYRNFPILKRTFLPENNQEKYGFTLFYAGLLGVAQGILQLIDKIKIPKNMEFHIYGNGPEAKKIAHVTENHPSIFYHGSIERQLLHQVIPKFDIGIIPLKNRIYGSVPSKIFEYAGLGLPIIYLSGGEGATIVKENNLGFVINDLDYKSLNILLKKISKFSITLPKKKDILEVSHQQFDLENQFEVVFNEINAV